LLVDDEVTESVPTGEESVTTEATGELDNSTVAAGEEPLEAETDTTESDGRPRNPDGTFAPKAPQAEPQGAEAPPIAPEATAQTPAPSVESKPFVFKADKREYTIEGATLTPQGDLIVPASQLQRTQQILSQGVYLEQNWRRQESEWKQRIEAAEKKAAPQDLVERETRANALLAELQAVLTDEDRLTDFISNLQVNGPALMAKAQARIYQEQLQKYQQAETQQQTQAQSEQAEAEEAEAFTEVMAEMKTDQRFKVFTPEDWQEFEDEMLGLKPVLFLNKDDGPEGPGKYLDVARMVNTALRQAKLLSRAQEIAQKQVSAVKQATQFNAARVPTQQPPKVPAPVVEAEKTPQNWDDWKKRNGIFN
jgi:hypothetical protein